MKAHRSRSPTPGPQRATEPRRMPLQASPIGNHALARVLQRLHSSSRGEIVRREFQSSEITSQVDGTVAKAPIDMAQARFRNRIVIHKLELANFPGKSGTVTNCEGEAAGVRVDKQGEFAANGKTWLNVQAQANGVSSNLGFGELRYPANTKKKQKGTSIGEVHVDSQLVGTGRTDVTKRTEKLIKQALFNSIGAKDNHPRSAYRVFAP